MSYTVVVPCFNESANIETLYRKVMEVLSKDFSFTILFVDDGSTDNTLEEIKKLRLKDKRVTYIRLLQNSGHQKALFAGLCSCKSDFAITMDADLQHPPESIPVMIEKQRETKAQIVAGKRKGQQPGILKNFFSKHFYRFFFWATKIMLDPGISDFRLYSRQALDILCHIKEREPFLRGMISNLGLPMETVEYELQERSSGEPAYTFGKSLRMAFLALFRFSKLPFRFGIFFGICGICLSVFMACHYIYLRLFTDQLVPGQADLMVFLGFLGSLILLQLSLLLKMSTHMIDSLQQQPVYIIEQSELEE